jgi:hypothetical protein
VSHAESPAAQRRDSVGVSVSDLDPRTGALLSVAQLQQALRQLRAETITPAQPPVTPGFGPLFPTRALSPGGSRGVAVVVRSAHSGAGSSTVALAIADAAAAAGQAVQLVGLACPADSGLVAVAETELGVDGTGRWVRGARRTVTVDRLVGDGWEDDDGDSWPPAPMDADTPERVTVVDVGQLAGTACPLTVLVCRVSVPGVRAAERALTLLSATTVLLAAVGPKRWPGSVAATAGPQVNRLRGQGWLVSVPVDHHLEVIGLTAARLPKPITAAGRQLLELAMTTDLEPDATT